MTSLSTTIAANTVPPNPATPNENKRLRWFEVCLVLLISLSNGFLASLYLYFHGPSSMTQGSSLRWLSGLLNHLLALALLGYVLSRSGRTYRDLGLRWSLRDCGIGVLLAIAAFASAASVAIVVQLVHHRLYGTFFSSHGREFWGHPGFRLLPYLLLTPIFEELLVRAYLMTEIIGLTGSPVLAVIVSVLVQTSYHLYYGGYGAFTLMFTFLVFALHYARYRRALPVIFAHELWDLVAFIRLW
jgi:membrane protease YdiL (CAAX protease family)